MRHPTTLEIAFEDAHRPTTHTNTTPNPLVPFCGAPFLSGVIARLAEDFGEPGVVNLLTAHLTVVGASSGGGEREAHTVMGYAVPATVFPPGTHYVALGHLHRSQQVIGPCPVRYSGSPLAVDSSHRPWTHWGITPGSQTSIAGHAGSSSQRPGEWLGQKCWTSPSWHASHSPGDACVVPQFRQRRTTPLMWCRPRRDPYQSASRRREAPDTARE